MSVAGAILVTGASGQIGSALVRHLKQTLSESTVCSLVRGVNGTPDTFAGDICRPDLGLQPAALRTLRSGLRGIIHCAASTQFTDSLADARATNVEGTRNVIDFAASCPRLDRFLHVSTVYVAGKRSGPLTEAPLLEPAGWFNSYAHSKFEAEDLVLRASNSLPVSIVRLSTAIGDSRTGESARLNYFHRLLQLAHRSPLPIIPGVTGAAVDVIADDWAAAVLQTLFETGETGRVYHACSGPEASPRIDHILDLIYRKRNGNGHGGTGVRPKLVSIEEFDAFLALLVRRGRGPDAALARTVAAFLPHLAVNQAFLNEDTTEVLRASGLPTPAIESYLSKVIDRAVAG